MVKFFHGTSRALGLIVEREGLKPEGAMFVPEDFRKSPQSEEGYTYFFEDVDTAKFFGCGTTKKVGIGKECQVFEIDTEKVPVERDPLLHDSFRHRGKIAPEHLKSTGVFECD